MQATEHVSALDGKTGYRWRRFRIMEEIRSGETFHTTRGKTARILGILKRKANDLKAVYELDNILRRFDVKDPVKYDFALFGIGVYEPDFQK
jgi:hypothetical protein